MKQTIIALLIFVISVSIMNAQNEDIISLDKDTTSTQVTATSIEDINLIVQDQDTIIQDQVVSPQDIIDIKEGLNQLLTAQLVGFEQVMIDAKKKAQRGFFGGMRTYLLISPVADFQSQDIRLDYGYNITNWLFLSFIFDGALGLFYENTNTFEMNIALGGEIGCYVLKSQIGDLSLKTAVATTVGPSNFKYTSYDAGVYFDVGLKTDRTKVSAGLGVKYYDSRSSVYGDNWGIFYTVGWKF